MTKQRRKGINTFSFRFISILDDSSFVVAKQTEQFEMLTAFTSTTSKEKREKSNNRTDANSVPLNLFDVEIVSCKYTEKRKKRKEERNVRAAMLC